MDAEEHVGVELLFETGHGLAEQMGFVLGADADVVLLGRDPANIGDGEEDDSSTRFEDNAGGVVVSGLTSSAAAGGLLVAEKDFLAGAIHGRGEALLGEGLEQVVHCVDLEGAQGVLIMRGGEDNVGLGCDVTGT